MASSEQAVEKAGEHGIIMRAGCVNSSPGLDEAGEYWPLFFWAEVTA